MKLDTDLTNRIEKHFSYQQSTDSKEIITTITILDADALGYWEEYPHTQAMLDTGVFTAFIRYHKDSDDPAGLLVTGLEEEGRLWLELLVVSVPARKKGITKHLLDLALSIAKNVGARILLVDAEEEEIYFYQTLGFEYYGSISNFYPDGSESTIMGMVCTS